jgi:amino acid transporter/nucleotide-binding universal stress UspA family protein
MAGNNSGSSSSNSSSSNSSLAGVAQSLRRPIQVIVVSSVMFSFISYWRTAAVVLCDMASTAYYIGGIVEGAIGKAAPWFILAVMIFSGGVCLIYLESCSLFVRGGVYRVVKEAMGGFLAKLSVSALMFDYILTGPISAVSSGQYIMGMLIRLVRALDPDFLKAEGAQAVFANWGAVAIAVAIVLYFFRQNLIGIHESSDKALKIMYATTVMGVVILIWCGITLFMRGGPVNSLPWKPDLRPKVEYQEVKIEGVDPVSGQSGLKTWVKDPATGHLVTEKLKDEQGREILDASGHAIDKPKINEATHKQEDPLGLINKWFPGLARQLRQPGNWMSMIGVIGILLAFGHSILAMSGEETLAQVYREVESPKMKNFKKAALVVCTYSLLLTGGISFLAVMLIPDEVRMKLYQDNLIGGLAMYMVGPLWARLALNGFVVVVGFLILAGAVNTAIIGSNGVLNRVAEDGVMPDWFLKPHRRYGTTHRILLLVVGLQLLTILLSRGDMYVLGEAYAFGVVWSFVFKALAMIVLRFKDRSPREFKVPLNFHVFGAEIPLGLIMLFLILLFTALLNLLTKETATIGGSAFTAVFLAIFMISERLHERRRGGGHHKHIEQFNQTTSEEISARALRLDKPYRKLVAIRSTNNLVMLEKTLAETDPDTTDVAVMTCQVDKPGDTSIGGPELDDYARKLMSAVVERAEKAGKHVQPLIVRTNNPLFAVINAARDLDAQELVMGASNVYSADEQIEQIAFYWFNLHAAAPQPLTIRILGPNRDLYFDLAGGNRIPKLGERRARSVAELREAGVGVRHVLVVHDRTSAGSDLFANVLTMLDPQVSLTLVPLPESAAASDGAAETDWLEQDMLRVKQLRREVDRRELASGDPCKQIVELAEELKCDMIIVGKQEASSEQAPLDCDAIIRDAECAVCVVTPPKIPQEVDE